MNRYPSPSLIVSIIALVIALGGAGYSATGGNFILGVNNNAGSQTGLLTNFNGRALAVQNLSTAAGASALGLVVGAGRPPFVTNSSIKVSNLNADRLDGLDSGNFALTVGENWRHVGDPGEPAFENSWTNYDNSPSHTGAFWAHASYRRDNFGVVHIRGMVKSGTLGQAIFRLTGRYCPWYHHTYPVISNGALGRITVTEAGSTNTCLIRVDTGSNVWISLEGVSYPEQSEDIASSAATGLSVQSPRESRGSIRGRP